MKKIGEYTVMGILTSDDVAMERISLFDGRFDTGYRITDFEISFSNRDNSSTYLGSAKLMTEAGASNRYWNWSRNNEVAWASCAWDANAIGAAAPVSIIDDENMIIEDLHIGCVVYNGENVDVNYKISFDKYDITDWQGALAMVRNKSQA